MTCARLHHDGEGYQDTDGTCYESLVEWLQVGQLGMCLCGDAEANLRYVRHGLRHIARLTEDREPGTDFIAWYREWHRGWIADGLACFGSMEARQFFFYWADAEALTEHGTSLPGWLTLKGRTLLQALDEVLGDA